MITSRTNVRPIYPNSNEDVNIIYDEFHRYSSSTFSIEWVGYEEKDKTVLIVMHTYDKKKEWVLKTIQDVLKNRGYMNINTELSSKKSS